MSHRTSISTGNAGVSDSGPLTVIAGTALIFNVVGLYAFTGVALCVFGYIAFTLFLASYAGRTTRNAGAAAAGNGVMLLSWVIALVGGALVGGFHWIEYSHAAYAALAAYALAVLIWVLGRAFEGLLVWLLPVAGVGMLAAVMQLGSPPGADDMQKKESWTPVNVTVVDEADRPIEGATVYLDLLHFWQSEPPLDGDRKWWSKHTTDADGMARMVIMEDPRFKRLLIRVQHEPSRHVYTEPASISACVGHVLTRLHTALPVHKIPYAFRIVMKQQDHPDSAVLAVDLTAPSVAAESARSIKFALTTTPELPWYDNRRTFNEYAVSKEGRILDAYIRESRQVIFQLGPDLAGRELTLHLLQRNWSQNEESYLELSRVTIDPIPLNSERTVPAWLPDPGSTQDPQRITDGVHSELRR